MAVDRPIPGTILFDGEVAQRGYALNKMCFSLNDEANRHAFLHDEDAYMDRYHLTPEQRDAVSRRDVLAMLRAGGNVYYLAKLAGTLGLGVQDIGALQTGMSVDEFKHRLLDAGKGT
jgi:protocatechuate 4,5-dioxygenase alpha chain